MGATAGKISGKENVFQSHQELVAKSMGIRWNFLALDLKFRREQIFEIEKENATMEGRCREMLQRWYEQLPQHVDAMTELTTALKKCEREDLIKKFEKLQLVPKEYRLLLVGRGGSGKSDTGNHILHALATDKIEQTFKTRTSDCSVTTTCTYKTAEISGGNILLVDTPPLFDADPAVDSVRMAKEMSTMISYVQPGPHSILVVVQVGHQTEENQNMMELLENIFGNDVYNYVIVVFTRKDHLDHQKMTLREYLYLLVEENEVEKLLKKCNGRCIAFNNRLDGDENEQQVHKLLDMVKQLVADNDGQCCTSLFQAELLANDEYNPDEHFQLLG